MQNIESEVNARFKRWRRLAEESRAVKKESATLLEGIHLAQVVLAHPALVKAVLLNERQATAEARDLGNKLSELAKAPLFALTPALYQALSPVEHGVGLMVEIALPTLTLGQQKAHLAQAPHALYLDGVQDAGNAGTLIRTAVAAGVKTIVASPSSALLWTPKVLRAGMGAHFGATIIENVSAHDFRAQYPGTLLAADARGGEDLFACTDYPEPTKGVAWIMGAEGPGVSEAALEVSNRRFYIPIEADCESLNVAAAAAVCMFEQRRRWKTGHCAT